MAGIPLWTACTTKWDLYARCDMLPTNDALLILNGVDPNRAFYDTTANVAVDLIPRAPAGELCPLLQATPSVDGKVFGDHIKWRFRYKDSKRNIASGLSPIPDEGWNVGALAANGVDHLGQTAWFYLPGTSQTGIDKIELFRNTTDQDDVWWLVDDANNPGSGSTVLVKDNKEESEIVGGESAGLFPNPSYFEGLPSPLSRIARHPTGRFIYYGVKRMGPYRAGALVATSGSNTVTGTNTFWTRAREGQALVVTNSTTISRHRIVEVSAIASMVVNPPLDFTGTATSYEIIDDRDARQFRMSEPNSPFQIDDGGGGTVGRDTTDSLQFIASFRKQTFALTKRVLVSFANDVTENPLETMQQTIEANEGTVGLWSACMTPLGLVYLHETEGVRVYDGMNMPRPLGAQDLADPFSPMSQFLAMEPTLLSEAYMYYNSDTKQIVLSAAGDGSLIPDTDLVFDLGTMTWRGPWRRITASTGVMRDSDGSDLFTIGDVFAILATDDSGTLDLRTSNDTNSGTFDGLVKYGVAVSDLTNASLTKPRAIGAPVILIDTQGNEYFNYIADVATGGILTFVYFVEGLTLAWTYHIGKVDWLLKTGYIDAGEPVQPKELDQLRLRMTSAAAGLFTVKSGDAGSTLTAANVTPDSGSSVYAYAKCDKGGRAFEIQLNGRASTGEPRIVQAVADVVVRGGA